MKTIISIITALALIPASLAADQLDKKLDNAVAAGIVFKLGYLLGNQGSSSHDPDSKHAEAYRKSLDHLQLDFANFSTSDYGKQLKQEAADLIKFCDHAVTSTRDGEQSEQAKLFYKKYAIPASQQNVPSLAAMMTEKLTNYANKTQTPEWVWNPELRGGENTQQTQLAD